MSNVILLLASLFLLGLLGAISNMNLALAIASSESLTHYDEPSMTTTTTKTKRMQCLGLDEDEKLDQLISNHRQLFVVFPAKAAGTTMKEFTNKCQPEFKNYSDNVVNHPETKVMAFKSSRHTPSVISSHLYSDKALIDLVKHATRQTLIIYIHREETSRTISAIKHRFYSVICGEMENKDTCKVPEGGLINHIDNLTAEIGYGAPRLLTCASYNAIDDHAPDLVFMNYKQADKLQRLISKHHCPEMLAKDAVRKNTHESHLQQKPMVLTEKFGEMELVDWLDLKKDTLEWTFGTRKRASCQASTKSMENAMFECPDETIQVLPKPLHF